MSLTSFTNEVGYHTKVDFVANSIVDHNYSLDSPPGNPQYVIHTSETILDLPIAFSNKPPIYKSPGHAPSDYWRYVGIVKANDPALQTVKVWNNFGHYYETWRDTRRYIAPTWHIPFTWDPVQDYIEGNTINKSVVEALNKIQDVDFSDPKTTVNFQGGNALAEARETGRMLAKASIKLMKAYRAAKGGHWKTVLDTLGLSKRTFIPNQTVSETWLELQYGWKPLMKDIHDLDQTVRHLLTRDHEIRVESSAHEEMTPGFVHGLYAYDCVVKESSRTVFLANLRCETAADLQSLGVINPFSVAWEIVPFSFVIDWFIPISSTLEALTSTAGFRNDGGWTSVHRNYEIHIRQNGVESGNTLVTPGHYHEVGFGFIRFAYTEWPPTRLYANPKPWSTPHVLNALALFAQFKG
ncbi:TPA_asm: maturation protein [ssRNA phage Zoerhiza.2_29]|uniref:Maturation protein n=2 Tax=Fiersviridae TaxID=2842319 RepID=A0A8S5L3S9_9VIRU|nr:maturation protein [ssRNA phage Zoerhiza.2_29]QDH86587.1 MAG: hypothetical protein H2Rhizo33814_000003 [Leviviridae sp.]DAD52039.1 TPA_asm: maturation protein [ssRNA phage Zoerhiza.2_29]